MPSAPCAWGLSFGGRRTATKESLLRFTTRCCREVALSLVGNFRFSSPLRPCDVCPAAKGPRSQSGLPNILPVQQPEVSLRRSKVRLWRPEPQGFAPPTFACNIASVRAALPRFRRSVASCSGRCASPAWSDQGRARADGRSPIRCLRCVVKPDTDARRLRGGAPGGS